MLETKPKKNHLSELLHSGRDFIRMLKFIFSLLPCAGAVFAFPSLGMALLVYFSLISLFTFLAYGADKLFAVMHWRRIPEDLLIVLGFCGGTPGAFAGMKIFHHKTAKSYFDKALTAAVILQSLTVAGFILAEWI